MEYLHMKKFGVPPSPLGFLHFGILSNLFPGAYYLQYHLSCNLFELRKSISQNCLSELKNKNTGIDIYVPKYETIPGHLGGTVIYHIIVVTRLFYFKSNSKYKESDVVQFMVSID